MRPILEYPFGPAVAHNRRPELLPTPLHKVLPTGSPATRTQRDYVNGIWRTPAWVMASIQGPTGSASTMTAISAQRCSKRARLSEVDLARRAGEHEAADPVVDPHPLLDRFVADALVASDHDQTLGTSDGQPLVVEAPPRDLRQVGMAGENDVFVQISECLTERQVVLVDEEPGRHVRLRRQRTQLLLVGDRGPYLLGGYLVATGDLLDRLAGVE